MLSEFRDRLAGTDGGRRVMDGVLAAARERGLLKSSGRARTDSTHVLSAARELNWLEMVAETLRAALNVVARDAPDWLAGVAEPDWFQHYATRIELVTEGPNEQAIVVELSELPAAARKVVVAAALDGAGTFADVGAIEIMVVPAAGEKSVVQATLDAATTERSLVLAEIYRRGPLWRFRAVGQGHDHDLATTARSFGVDITD